MSYEAQTLLGSRVSLCRTHVSVRHRHDTDTYDYIELCRFLNFYRRVSVSAVSGVRVGDS
jgi:hypothetical protein